MIHSYPWYPKDWRGSETRMRLTLAGRSIYRDLLDHCWEEGSLPTDHRILAGIAGSADLATAIREKRPEVERWHEQKRNAGLKSAEAKRQRNGNGRSTDVGTKQGTAFQPSASSTVVSSSLRSETAAAARTEPPPGTPDPQQAIAFVVHEIADCWPMSCSEPHARTAAEREWAKSQTAVDEWCGRLLQSAHRWADFHRLAQRKRGHFIPNVPRWLADGDYARMPPGMAEPGKKAAPVCMTCGGNTVIWPGVGARGDYDDTEAWLQACHDAEKPCPDCTKGAKCP